MRRTGRRMLRRKFPRLTRALRAISYILYGALTVGVIFAVSWATLDLLNAEYFTRTPELVTLSPPRYLAERRSDLTLRLRLLGFDETTGRAKAQLQAFTTDDRLAQRLRSDSVRVYVYVIDGMSTNLLAKLAATRLTFPTDTFPGVEGSVAESVILDLSPRYLSNVSVFPSDAYFVRLLLHVVDGKGEWQPFTLEVEKSYFTRTLEVEGTADEVRVKAYRPPLDRIIVLASSLIFLIAVGFVVYSISSDPRKLSGAQEAIALAALLLSATGFRDFAGFSALPTRTFLDVVIFLIPLVATAGAYGFRLAIDRRKPRAK